MNGSQMTSIKLPKNLEFESANEVNNCEGTLSYVEHQNKYRLVFSNTKSDKIRYLNSKTCNLLFEKTRDIHATVHVHHENSNSSLETRTLGELSNTGYLETDLFAVYGNYKGSARPYAPDFSFEHGGNRYLQDQIQTYYNLDYAFKRLEEVFSYNLTVPFVVFTHTELTNNARYLPPYGEYLGEIQLGTPDGEFMQNLNNDADVIVHELGHHILFPYISEIDGESTVLHEGTADFLAYVVHENEQLGETIMVGGRYLRANEEVWNLLYDEKRYEWPQHRLGQFWSAYLTNLYKKYPVSFPEIYMASFDYYSPNADISEAIVAYLESADNSGQLTEEMFCDVLNEASKLGMIKAISNIDSGNCSLENPEVNYRNVSSNSNDSPGGIIENVSNGCGVIGGSGSHSAVIIYLVPLGLLLLRRRRNES